MNTPYFDNGVNPREYDEVKLRAAAYYYNGAAEWGRPSTLATKDVAYLFGSVRDFEKQLRSPRWVYPGGWQCDDALGSTWGYTDGMRYRSPESVIQELIELASMGGNLLLNVSPMEDGSVPEAQQQALRVIGEWLKVNGEAIYGSRPWTHYGEGPSVPKEAPGDWAGGSTASLGPKLSRWPPLPLTEAEFRFTTNNRSLYVFGLKWPSQETPEPQAIIRSLAAPITRIERVTLLGAEPKPLRFKQNSDALYVSIPSAPATSGPYTLRVEGYELF